jgi:hypothetical protein
MIQLAKILPGQIALAEQMECDHRLRARLQAGPHFILRQLVIVEDEDIAARGCRCGAVWSNEQDKEECQSRGVP